jgi:hypothetical protein
LNIGGIFSNDDFSSILVYPRLDRRSDIMEERDLVNIYWGRSSGVTGVAEMGMSLTARASVKMRSGKQNAELGNSPRERVSKASIAAPF